MSKTDSQCVAMVGLLKNVPLKTANPFLEKENYFYSRDAVFIHP
jgi:hypothetical protein